MTFGLTASRPLQRSASASISDALREAIFEGRLSAGTQLKQNDLAAEFGVSAIPVREAFQTLVAEGLAITHRHRGVIVAPMSEADIVDIAELRALLEAEALRLSAPYLTAADLDEADATLAKARVAGNKASHAALHFQFHRALYGKAGRPRLLTQIDTLFVHMNRYVMLAWRSPWLHDDWETSHVAITDRLRAGDTEGAVGLIVDQIRDATARVISHLKEQAKADAEK